MENTASESTPARSAVAGPVPSTRATLLIGVTAAIIAFTLYSGTFRAPFISDDLEYVRDNPLVHSLRSFPAIWTNSYPPGKPLQGLYRPVTEASYLADSVISGLASGPSHVTNAVLHAAATALFTLAFVCLGGSVFAASAAGLVFATQTVHTEAVSWIVGRAEVLAGVLCFAAVLTWIEFRKSGKTMFLTWTAIAYFFALGAKETAAPLPAALLLCDTLGLVPEKQAAGRRQASIRELLRPYAALAAAFAAYALLRINAIGRFGMDAAGYAFARYPESTRFASAWAIIGKYTTLCVIPLGFPRGLGRCRALTGAIYKRPRHSFAQLRAPPQGSGPR